jgi:nucleoside-diphosphate-sugar epimerase
MRILIAGATGAIGRPSVRRLIANQHEVFALRDRQIPHPR